MHYKPAVGTSWKRRWIEYGKGRDALMMYGPHLSHLFRLVRYKEDTKLTRSAVRTVITTRLLTQHTSEHVTVGKVCSQNNDYQYEH